MCQQKSKVKVMNILYLAPPKSYSNCVFSVYCNLENIRYSPLQYITHTDQRRAVVCWFSGSHWDLKSQDQMLIWFSCVCKRLWFWHSDGFSSIKPLWDKHRPFHHLYSTTQRAALFIWPRLTEPSSAEREKDSQQEHSVCPHYAWETDQMAYYSRLLIIPVRKWYISTFIKVTAS